MGLTLTTLRCPESVAPQSRQLSGGEFSIGRGADNDWVLPDPDRHMSKRHCVLAYRSGVWQLSDTSSNGTFLNRGTAPVGAAPKTLRDGDRIRIGAYEMEVAFTEDVPAYTPPGARGGQPGGFLSPATLDPFADTPSRGWNEAGAPSRGWDDADPLLHPPPGHGGLSPQLPADFDPLASEDPFGPTTRSDHTPAINDAFRPPPAPAVAIPDDWDLDLTPSPVAPPPKRSAVPVISPPLLPDDDDLVAPPSPPVPPPPAAPAPVVTVAAPPVDTGLLAAFLDGAGLTDAPANPAGILRMAGAALRAAVAGIRQTLIARASIKSEFRIEQTMVRASGNNPLKFSANDDDAMAGLLGIGRRNAMPADRAMADALRDIRLHELATVAAMQSAVRTLLARFDPAALEHGLGAGSLDKLPGQRKARAWDAFATLHASVSQALSDDFDSVFGKAFARAYEQSLRDAQDGDGA